MRSDIRDKQYRSIGGHAPPIALVAAALIVAAALSACERRDVGRPGTDPGPVVARVNGKPLYRVDLDAYLPDAEGGGVTSEERKTHFDRWVATQLLYEEAARAGLGVSDDIARRIELYQRDLVADRLVEQVLKERAIVTREDALAYYRAHRDEYNLEARVSHILTNTIEDAMEAQEMLKTRPFSWVARKMSVDRHTGGGGDLGYLSKGNMLPEFEDVVFKMQVGEVSGIVESEFGYHILKLNDVRTSPHELTFDVVAPEISRQLLLDKRAAVFDSLVAALNASARIEVVDPELKYALEMAESLRVARAAAAARGDNGWFTQAVPEPGERAGAAAPADTIPEAEDVPDDEDE